MSTDSLAPICEYAERIGRLGAERLLGRQAFHFNPAVAEPPFDPRRLIHAQYAEAHRHARAFLAPLDVPLRAETVGADGGTAAVPGVREVAE